MAIAAHTINGIRRCSKAAHEAPQAAQSPHNLMMNRATGRSMVLLRVGSSGGRG